MRKLSSSVVSGKSNSDLYSSLLINRNNFYKLTMYILVPKKHLGKIFPQICSLKKLSSSVVSDKLNSDLYSSLLINRNNFYKLTMYILVPKKHLGKIFPQICSLKKLSSSVVSGKLNSDLYSSLLINRNNFYKLTMYILVPKKHPGKIFPQICSLKKQSSSVVSGKPNSDNNICINHY